VSWRSWKEGATCGGRDGCSIQRYDDVATGKQGRTEVSESGSDDDRRV